MDSLEVYSILLTQYIKNGNQINKSFVQLAYKLLNELILKNIQIEPNWGPFQELVDAFLCSVADVKNTDESFMSAFKYFYLQQRHDKAAGCIYRRCQRIISEINRFKLQTEIISSQQVILKMQKLVKYLAICLSTCNLSADKRVIWGYNVQGANEVMIQQLLQYEDQLILEGAEDRYEVNQKQYQLNQLDNKIRQQQQQYNNNIYEVYTYDEILQQFIYYQSLIELIGAVPGATVKGQYNRTNNTFSKPGGVSITLPNTYLTDCRTAISLKPFEVFNGLLNQGNVDQALTMMKAFDFSGALIIQHLVKQMVLLMDKMTQTNVQNIIKQYKLSFNQNVNIPGLTTGVDRKSKYLNGETEGYRTSDSRELEDLLLLLTQIKWYIQAQEEKGQLDTVGIDKQLNGQTSYLQFADTFDGEAMLAAAITSRGLPQAKNAMIFQDFCRLIRIDAKAIFDTASTAQQERYQQLVIMYDLDFLRQIFKLQPAVEQKPIPKNATAAQITNQMQNQVFNQFQRPQIKSAPIKPRIVSQYGQAQLHNYIPPNPRKQSDLTTDDLAVDGVRPKAKFNADITGGRRIGAGLQYQREGSVNPLLRPQVQPSKQNNRGTMYQPQQMQQQQMYNNQMLNAQQNLNHFDQSLKNIENKLHNMGINLNSAAPQSILRKSGGGSGIRKSVGFAQD